MTSDAAQARQVHAVCALSVIRTGNSPAVRNTKADGISGVVARVDNRWVGRLSGKVLECTLVGTRRLAVDLNLITTKEGCDPIIWPVREGNTALDADIGTGVVDRELASGNCLAVVAADLRPLKDVDAIRDPGRDLHVLAFARMCVARVEAVAVAIPSVALALDDVLIAEEVLLILGADVVSHSLNQSHLDKATIVVVPPPLDRDLLAALEDVLIWDVGATKAAGILIRGCVRRILVSAWCGLIHVRVGNDRRGGEEKREKDVLEHDEEYSVRLGDGCRETKVVCTGLRVAQLGMDRGDRG